MLILDIAQRLRDLTALLRTKDVTKDWIAAMIKQCGFTTAYFNSHRSDVKSVTTTNANKQYCKLVDEALFRSSTAESALLAR